ncbi:CLUMA_CG013137, isoform A [Clunio marinus]|uniref:snRNA-activating protein complex subunit 3 n=1 Tax=Clunio marinus TaxID=568069 RepID=A0A1J1IHV3_9DIPT|nr:CLUMA_CG013137, isoform A [Clunio marinus]
MEGKKFQDLNIRLGYPCVYQHHGACEHIFCITSVDLLDSSDNLKRSAYPIISKLSRKRSKLCDICGQMDANYLVTNCALHVKDPMNLCSGCFFSFHYEKDGMTKIGSFNAYRIFSANP